MLLQTNLAPSVQPTDQSCSIQASFTKKKILLTHLPVDSMLKITKLLCLICFFFFSFTETFSLSINVCSSSIGIINTEVIWRSFNCEEGPTARSSSKICLQTGRNKELKICHCSILTSYAPRAEHSFMGPVGTASQNWLLVLPLGLSSKFFNKQQRPCDWSRRKRGY